MTIKTATGNSTISKWRYKLTIVTFQLILAPNNKEKGTFMAKCYTSAMAHIIFTDNLRRHIDCPAQTVSGGTVAQLLAQVFNNNPRLRGYLLDDQSRLRKHMLISINGRLIEDRIHLSDRVPDDAEVYIMQALSGG